MEKERKIKTLSVIALIVAVLGLTVAFASLATELTINGTAEVEAASWNVQLANLQPGEVVGGAEIQTEAKIDQETHTTIEGLSVKLTKPGDSVTYTFDVVNSGTLDAAISKLMGPLNTIEKTHKDRTLATCTSASSKTEDETLICGTTENKDAGVLKYTLTYANGDPVAVGDVLDHNSTKDATAHLVLTISYDINATSLPSDDVSVTDLNVTMTYAQK